MLNKITPETIQAACDHLAKILVQKNHDYGNSVEEQFKEYGPLSLNVRLDDKMRRLKQLTIHKQPAKVNETPADTTLDLAGYAILAYLLLSSEPKRHDLNYQMPYHDQDHQY